jgi:hypothetical protein
MPYKDQKDSFLTVAIESVLKQTSPHWRLLVLFDPECPAAVRERVAACADERISSVESQGHGLGGTLNTGMRVAESAFVCILLSDGCLAPTAVATVLS